MMPDPPPELCAAQLPAPLTTDRYGIFVGDVRELIRRLPDRSVHCAVTSPPYFGLRDYGEADQFGLEATPDLYVAKLVALFQELRRVLRDDGTFWLNLGDSYVSKATGNLGSKITLDGGQANQAEALTRPDKTGFGLEEKNLIGIPWRVAFALQAIPWRVAFALQADGWYLRQDLIWHKPNPMPESVTDRCTKAHEYVFLFAKSKRYYFDQDAIKEPSIHAGRIVKATGVDSKNAAHVSKNETKLGFTKEDKLVAPTRIKRSVWTVSTKPFKGAHFATFPVDLVEPMILAGAPKGGIVFDPFSGAGTTGVAALKHGRHYLGCELNPAYAAMSANRLHAL